MPSAGITPEAVPRKGGKKKGNRINSYTDGFVARKKGLKNERDQWRCTLLGIKKVGREAPARDDHSPCRPGDRSLAGAETKKARSSRSTKIAIPIKVRICNCLSLTRPSRPLHCVSSRSRGGLGRPLTATPLQARALIGQNGDPCRSGRHPCDVPNQLAPVHRIYRRQKISEYKPTSRY